MKGRYLDDQQRKWIREWWAAIHPREAGGPPLSPSLAGLGRAARARLKRCDDIDGLIIDAGTHRLASRLLSIEASKAYPRFEGNYVVVALIAGALASVREDTASQLSLAAQLGGDTPVMSELRFLRLMRSADLEDFYRQLQRALQLAGREADVAVLANDIVAWLIEQTHPLQDPNQRLKARWARDYYLPARDRVVVEKSILETAA